jgi:hypothetical protein
MGVSEGPKGFCGILGRQNLMRSELAFKVPCPVYFEAVGQIMCPDQAGDYGLGCIECRHLLRRLAEKDSHYSWVCPWCLSAVKTDKRPYRNRLDKKLLYPEAVDIPGFYGEGVCEATLIDGSRCSVETGLLSLVIWSGDLRLPTSIDWGVEDCP